MNYNYYDSNTDQLFSLTDKLPILQLKQKEQLKDSLYNYVQTYLNSCHRFTQLDKIDFVLALDENKLRFALTNLFINASFEDFEEINKHIKLRTDFLKSNLSQQFDGKWKNAGQFSNVNGAYVFYRIAENFCNLETPERLEVKVERTTETGDIQTVYLPFIAFGISEEQAYIYTIQNLKAFTENNEPVLQKKLNRARYSLNKGVPVQEQNVEPFALVSTSILSGVLKSLDVTKINVKTFLPIRYNAKYEAYIKKAKNNEMQLKELLEKQQIIQENLTTKFLDTFLRTSKQTGAFTLYSDLEPSCTIFKNTQTQPNSESANDFLIHLHDTATESLQQNFKQ